MLLAACRWAETTRVSSFVADAIMAGLDSGAAQVYFPEYFKDLAASKAQDVGAFLAGTAGYLREQKAKKG